MWKKVFAVVWSVLFVTACSGPPVVSAAPSPSLSPEEQALIDEAASFQDWPDEEDLPVPPDGWYSVELAGDTIEVFRDEYGVPHVFAPSVEAAFRAQGYVIAEDRCIQMLTLREAGWGRRAAMEGGTALGYDEGNRLHGYSREEMQEMLDALRPDQRRYLEEYIVGTNEYLKRHVPQAPLGDVLDVVAGVVPIMNEVGDIAGEEMVLYELVNFMSAFRGEEFAQNMLNDCVPADVPTAPTTDHSHLHRKTVAATSQETHAEFNMAEVLAYYEKEIAAKDFAREDGVLCKWGSQVWAVGPERSATGHAMLFSGPMMHFTVPARGAQIHLVAPGLNVMGLCFPGVPGVLMGHNDRIAWGVTSGVIFVGVMDQRDLFVEELNPDNELQYKHNGEWKDMEVLERPIVVRDAEGQLGVRPYSVYRTVHGPVVRWEKYNNRAYSSCSSHDKLQLESYAAFMDMNLAQNFDEFEKAVRSVATSHNFVAADVDGNIGYWLAGRIPNRHPAQDLRLPTPGTGERDWQGSTVATDLVRCINPPEGYLQNFNNKPSTNIPGWWPEIFWSYQIDETLRNENPIDWDTFVGINEANAMHHWLGPFLRPYLLDLLKTRANGDPDIETAIVLLEDWDYAKVPGASAALLFDEWLAETLMEILEQDFKPIVRRSVDLGNIQLFGAILFRILDTERAGVELRGDYLHGRDKDEIAFRCFRKVLDDLIEKHGRDMNEWPFNPGEMEVQGLSKYPTRTCGTHWTAVDMGPSIRSTNMLVPGQSGLSRSPHYQDQLGLFRDWQLKEFQFAPEDFDRALPG